jgi:3-oxoacyl-[acyl-carrier-protein] synthase-3
MKMDGKEVFKHAVTCMNRVAQETLQKAGVAVEDVKLIIPHQANMRIVQAIGQRLGGRPDQYFVNLDKYGNTSAASVIIALDEAARMGRLASGDLVLLIAFGGGFTWGSALLEW